MKKQKTDKTLTIFEGEVWSLMNVYIFPEKNREVRGVMWVIPGCDNPNVTYGDGSGFSAQNFIYDQIKLKIADGTIPQDDWIIVIAPRHKYSFEQMSANSDEVFEEQGFNFNKHVDLCDCCTDPSGREYLNIVYAVGDGANMVDFDDPIITNIVLIDPILYPPIDIPNDRLDTITMVSNPDNHDPLTESGNASLIVQEELGSSLGNNIKVPGKDGAFNHMGLFAAGLLAFCFSSTDIKGGTVCGINLKDLMGEADINRELDDEIVAEDGVTADPSNTPAEVAKEEAKTEHPEVAPPSEYKAPQIIINSDRLIFNAKKDNILISSNTHIGLSANGAVGIDADAWFTVDAPEINLGLNATEPILLGDTTGDWLDGLITAIQALTYTNAGGPTGPAINAASLNAYKSSIPSLKSPQNKTL